MNLRKKIAGVLTRQAAKQAGAIRAALRNSLDVDALVADWERQNFTTMSKADARAWAQMNAQPRNMKAIRAALSLTIATGYLLGENASQAYYAKAKTGRKIVKAAPTAEDIDSWLDADYWDSWSPGNKPAALLVRPPGALSDLLDKAGATINGLNRTTMNRLGTILGEGLERGSSGKSIADAIDKLLDDPARALTIANTEMARAMSTASMETYNGFGVEKVEWLHDDACNCALCIDAEGMGPQPIGTDFGDGVTEPPMHPNCICAIAPVIDEGDGSGLDLVDFVDDSDSEAGEESLAELLGRSVEEQAVMENRAVEAYTAGGYRDINAHLRDQESLRSIESFERTYNTTPEQAAKDLASLIDKSPNALDPNETVYRGVRGSYAEELLGLQVGDRYVENGFTSTTSAPDIAELFTDSPKYATIVVQNSDAKFVYGVVQEQERILTSSTKFEVIKTDQNERKVYVRVVND